MKAVIILIVLLLVVGGVYMILKPSDSTASHGQAIPADARIVNISNVTEDAKSSDGKLVTLQGEITEKCPTTGCWFYLQDKTGKIRVDTAPSNFTIQDIPTGTKVKVHGRVSIPEEGEPEIIAIGVH